jgi:hypothetical protein
MTTPGLASTLGLGQGKGQGQEKKGIAGWWGRIRHWFANEGETWDTLRLRSLLWSCNVLVLSALALLLFPRLLPAVLEAERHRPPIDVHFAVLVLCACATPPLLARLCYSLINRKAASQRLFVAFPPAVDAALADRAISAWMYEVRRNRGSLTRAESFAGLWGLLTSLVLVGAVTFLLPPFHEVQKPFQGPHNMVAFAVLGAVVTRFLLDLARMCVRTSNDDASKRMFAESFQVLTLSVVATLAVMLLWNQIKPLGPNNAAGLSSALPAMGIGAGVAIVGVPAFEYVVEKVSSLLGISRPPPPSLIPLSAVAGMSAAEMNRLAEEGIDSVEGLISTPIPRIFLGTRFSLQRICDWYDKGLLVCRVGAVAAAELRARAGLTGALEILRVAKDAAANKGVMSAIKKAMRLDTDEEAAQVVAAVAADDAVTMLALFRQTQLADRSVADDDVSTKAANPPPDPAGAKP